MKNAILAFKKKCETLETKCEDIDFLMTQTSHLLSDYEGFNNDVEKTNENIKNIDEIIKMQGEMIKDLSKWKNKQMEKEWKKPKEEKLNEFQGGIVLVKDKILHLKKLTLMTDDDTHKQHLCDYHLQIIYRLMSQYVHDSMFKDDINLMCNKFILMKKC